MRSLWIAVLAVAVGLPAHAADRYIAFGDSITEGVGDSSSPSGYPPKLQKLLRNAGLDVDVDNFGVAGESTFEGLQRLDAALAGGGEGLLLMEGTNDVTLIADGLVSVESVTANLDAMVSKAKPRGFQVYLGTVIPRAPSAKKDDRNEITQELNWAIYELAASRNLPFADGWASFNPFFTPDVFKRLYSGTSDPVGHPNSDGYQVLAELWADQILEIDRVPPVPGRFEPYLDEISGATNFLATFFESKNGTGIKLDETHLLVNGEVAATARKGASNKKRAQMKASLGRRKLGCRVALALSSRDRAEPPNVYTSLLWVYSVAGQTHIPADVDGDCTVDSLDLGQLAEGFGRQRGEPGYNLLLDFNDDKIVDGLDLAILASSFGLSSEDLGTP